MKTTPPARKQDVKDPIGVTGWPKEKGRDGERTPMQWDGARTRAHERHAVAASAAECRDHQRGGREGGSKVVAGVVQEPDRLKKTNPAFANGANLMLDTENTKVLSWMRQAPVRQRRWWRSTLRRSRRR